MSKEVSFIPMGEIVLSLYFSRDTKETWHLKIVFVVKIKKVNNSMLTLDSPC